MRDGGPIYPQVVEEWRTCEVCHGAGTSQHGTVGGRCLTCGGSGKTAWKSEHPGMSLRDHFAAAALQGLISNEGGVNHNLAPETAGQYMEIDAKRAYAYADAMLKVRDQS